MRDLFKDDTQAAVIQFVTLLSVTVGGIATVFALITIALAPVIYRLAEMMDLFRAAV